MDRQVTLDSIKAEIKERLVASKKYEEAKKTVREYEDKYMQGYQAEAAISWDKLVQQIKEEVENDQT